MTKYSYIFIFDVCKTQSVVKLLHFVRKNRTLQYSTIRKVTVQPLERLSANTYDIFHSTFYAQYSTSIIVTYVHKYICFLYKSSTLSISFRTYVRIYRCHRIERNFNIFYYDVFWCCEIRTYRYRTYILIKNKNNIRHDDRG